MEKDATAEIQIDVLIRPSAAGATLENLVLVEAAEDDPDDSNNLDQVATRVQAGSGVFSDLSLSKVDSADPLEPGASLIYTLTVRNDGPSTAPGVTLFDRLPQEVTLVSVQASQGACSESNGIVRCELGTLKTGGSAGVEISVLANSSDVTLLNEAFVESDRDDPDGSNNSASEETVVLGGAGLETNLVLTKSGSPNPVEPGGSLSYLLTVTNLGPNTATEVVVQDQLPSGVTLVSGEVQQGVCFESEEQSIACQLGVLPSGASAQVRIDVNVNSSVASTSLLNQAFVEFAGEDVDPEDNFAEAEITVLGSTGLGSDLRLEKEDSPDPVEPGGLLTYTLSVKNTGPGPAVGVLLRDDLSFGVTLVSVESTQGTCSTTERVVGCELGNLENGGIATVEIIVQVDPSAAGAILSNTAFVRSSSVDFNDDNNSVLQETTVLGSSGLEADLALTKIDSVDPVEPGSVLAYALTVENKGPNVANGVVLVDILPSKVSFGSADASQGDCSHTDGVVDCNLGALQPEALVTVQILVEVDSSVTSTTLLNSAFVEGLEPDSNIDNNSAQEETTISSTGLGSDLSLSMADSPDPVQPGGTLTYSLAVSNAGPASATEVRVSDSLPPEVTLLSAEASQGGCFPSQGFVVCILGTLPSGTTAAAEIEVIVDSAFLPAAGGVAPAATQTIINSALVQSSSVDFNDDNNSAQVETAILGSGGEQVDLSVSKTDSSDPVEPGDSLTYTVIVTNGGPSDATGVVLGDPLPFGVNFVSAQANQGSCAESAGFVACNLGSVESGASAGAEINVTIDPSVQVETLFNSAFADSDQEDTNGDNNFDQEETTVLVTSEPLAIFTTSLPNGLVEQAYFASLAATGGAPPYTWSILNGSLPPGLSGDSSGFIGGTPSSSGSFPINVGVMDNQGATDSRTFTIEIEASAGDPVTITTASLPDGTVNDPYFASLAATGGTPPYTWKVIAGSLPPGLSGDPSGFISGTPSSSGTFPLGIEVTDSEEATDSRGFSIFVDTSSGAPLTIDTVSLPMGTVGVPYSASVLVSGGTPPYSWSALLPGSLPPGLMVADATGLIFGTPSSSGSFSFDIEVHDSGVQIDSRTFTVVIDPGAGLTIDTVSLPMGTVGVPYSAPVLVSGGTPPYFWSELLPGSLPPGLMVDDATGLITGTPSSSGSFSFDIEVHDSGVEMDSRTFTIVIDPGAGLTIDTVSLPMGTVGIPYSVSLLASGGTPPYSWLVTAGSLPPGLDLLPAGLIDGTPSSSGVFTFDIEVMDSGVEMDSRTFTVVIDPWYSPPLRPCRGCKKIESV